MHSVHITAISPLAHVSSGRKILTVGFISFDLGLAHSFWKYAVIDKKLLISINFFPGMCVSEYVCMRPGKKKAINS